MEDEILAIAEPVIGSSYNHRVIAILPDGTEERKMMLPHKLDFSKFEKDILKADSEKMYFQISEDDFDNIVNYIVDISNI